jgi:hypothetical protein
VDSGHSRGFGGQKLAQAERRIVPCANANHGPMGEDGTSVDPRHTRPITAKGDEMSDLKNDPGANAARAAATDIDKAAAERKLTPLQTALEKWEKYFTPEEQAALRAYESEQGTVE